MTLKAARVSDEPAFTPAFKEILEQTVSGSRGRRNPPAVKRKVVTFPIRHRRKTGAPGKIRFADHIVIIK